MMINFDKKSIKEQLTLENIFDLLSEWGAEPEYAPFGILSSTICHNDPGMGSRKLYYYTANSMFKCYTGCEQSSFDIYDLAIKVFKIQKNQIISLNDSVHYIASYFNISGEVLEIESFNNDDWEKFEAYDRISEIVAPAPINTDKKLKIYDDTILSRFNYSALIYPWAKEDISLKAMKHAKIGYYPGEEQITIPHYDINGNLIGIRGRSLIAAEAEVYGKYRPLKIGNILYSHPLGYNLYNLNNSKDNIAALGKAIVVEGEKSCLHYQTMFGIENDITVASCGSNISTYQMQLLLSLGVKEVIVAFDREGSEEEKKKYIQKFYKLNERFGGEVLISFVYDKNGKYLDYKDSPLDKDKKTFMTLFKNRIIL